MRHKYRCVLLLHDLRKRWVSRLGDSRDVELTKIQILAVPSPPGFVGLWNHWIRFCVPCNLDDRYVWPPKFVALYLSSDDVDTSCSWSLCLDTYGEQSPSGPGCTLRLFILGLLLPRRGASAVHIFGRGFSSFASRGRDGLGRCNLFLLV